MHSINTCHCNNTDHLFYDRLKHCMELNWSAHLLAGVHLLAVLEVQGVLHTSAIHLPAKLLT